MSISYHRTLLFLFTFVRKSVYSNPLMCNAFSRPFCFFDAQTQTGIDLLFEPRNTWAVPSLSMNFNAIVAHCIDSALSQWNQLSHRRSRTYQPFPFNYDMESLSFFSFYLFLFFFAVFLSAFLFSSSSSSSPPPFFQPSFHLLVGDLSCSDLSPFLTNSNVYHVTRFNCTTSKDCIMSPCFQSQPK